MKPSHFQIVRAVRSGTDLRRLWKNAAWHRSLVNVAAIGPTHTAPMVWHLDLVEERSNHWAIKRAKAKLTMHGGTLGASVKLIDIAMQGVSAAFGSRAMP